MSDRPPATPSDSLRTWLGLDGHDRWQWWDDRWQEAIALAERYRLALRSGWWQDAVAVEALAAFAAWVNDYDTGFTADPHGKVQLLAELDWLRTTLRGGERAFQPAADRPAFDRYLLSIGARPPDQRPIADPPPDSERQRDHLTGELAALKTRLRALSQRAQALRTQSDRGRQARGDHADRDLALLERTIGELRQQRRDLGRQLRQTRQCAS